MITQSDPQTAKENNIGKIMKKGPFTYLGSENYDKRVNESVNESVSLQEDLEPHRMKLER